MKKLEMKFLTGLRKDFKRHDLYFYKIPDTPATIRFQIAKPFDCFIGVDGGLGGMEAKYLDGDKKASIKLNDLRETQHVGLQDMIDKGGQAWVFYQIKFGRELRLYFWEYREFVRLCKKFGSNSCPRIPVKDLEGQRYILGAKNRFDVLEYELGPFIEKWRVIGEIYGTNI